MRLNLGQRHVAIAASMVFGLAGIQSVQGQVPVDLNTWSKKGPAGNGNWVVAVDGSNVLQTINGNPTFFVSPNAFFNTTVNGSFGVETNSDDDFIGFVFGYQTPQSTGTDFDFLLFDWKQTNQSGSTAGFTLSRVLGTNPNLFDNHQTSKPGQTVLATNVGAGRGWADNVVYDFSLNYRDDRITIGVDGGAFNDETIFDVTLAQVDPNGTLFGGAFPSGQFGFYNYSQANVRYQSFTQADDPVLETTPSDGDTLIFPAARVGGSPSTATLVVTNAGGLGSELTGSVPAIAGVFNGAGGSFTLDQNESSNFDVTFTPSARGVAMTSLTVDGDTPALDSTVNLSAAGVGPDTQISGYDMGGFDFGTIGSNDTATLVMNLGNATTDSGSIELVGLTTDYEITGIDADKFSFDLLNGAVFGAGGSDAFNIVFDPNGEGGNFTAVLTIKTDENAAFGMTSLGSSYSFQLFGSAAIPEPTTLLSLSAIAGLALSRRRRS